MPGELIYVRGNLVDQLRINGKKLTRLKDDIYFYLLGIYDSQISILSIQQHQDDWFFNPKIIWHRKGIKIDKVDLETGNKLRLSRATWDKVSKDEALRKAQSEKINSIIHELNGPSQTSCWDLPINSKVTSNFGSPRFLPNGRGYYHSGVDLRGWVGTPIKAAASGKVVLAEHMIVPGNNIVLSHGGQLYSRYLHLSEIKVNLGDQVTVGDVIGLSGNTGRVEAAHLHWEILWKGAHADPLLFIKIWNQYCESRESN